MTNLWEQCKAVKSESWEVPYADLDDFFEQRMNITTCRRADVMKKGVSKSLHA